MLKNERLELGKVMRLRAKVAKSEVDKRISRCLADVEAQLATSYPSNHEAWAELTKEAGAYVKQIDNQIAERCGELGIPERFRPGVHLSWHSKGENAIKDRVTELRRIAQTELAARAKAARAEIDRQTAIHLTELASGLLETADAKAFLERMPSAEQLIPPVAVGELEALAQHNPGTRMFFPEGL